MRNEFLDCAIRASIALFALNLNCKLAIYRFISFGRTHNSFIPFDRPEFLCRAVFLCSIRFQQQHAHWLMEPLIEPHNNILSCVHFSNDWNYCFFLLLLLLLILPVHIHTILSLSLSRSLVDACIIHSINVNFETRKLLHVPFIVDLFLTNFPFVDLVLQLFATAQLPIRNLDYSHNSIRRLPDKVFAGIQVMHTPIENERRQPRESWRFTRNATIKQ